MPTHTGALPPSGSAAAPPTQPRQRSGARTASSWASSCGVEESASVPEGSEQLDPEGIVHLASVAQHAVRGVRGIS